MKLPNINCKHYTKSGSCTHPGKEKVFFFFTPACILIDSLSQCSLQEQFEKPDGPPPNPNQRKEGEDRGPAPRPPKREFSGPNILNKKEVKQRVTCLKKHQQSWVKYSVGRVGEGRARFVVCSLCGSRHLLNDILHTEEDTERMRRNLL